MTEKKSGKLRILVAPLDWGLGHATRCIPIIRELLARDCEVWLSGEGAQKALLTQEFPQLRFLDLEGYRIKYAKSATGLIFGIFRQIRQIKRSINNEHKWLQQVVSQYHFDAIISDNRYGLYHPQIPSVFITHQLLIKSPFGKWSERWLQQKNYSYINCFSQCWIPDAKEKNILAGDLSHPEIMPNVPVTYLGTISRFQKKEVNKKSGHLLVLLSGPEPQRSLLENKIIDEISYYQHTATVVRGLPDVENLIPSTNMIQFYNHLSSSQLNEELQKASIVIARSGYSTVMDIAAMGQKSILIPTFGQTEQEYLAHYLAEKKMAPFVSQKDFSLSNALALAHSFQYKSSSVEVENCLNEAITLFVESIKN